MYPPGRPESLPLAPYDLARRWVFPTFAMPCAQTRKVVQLSGEPRPYCDESSTLISLIDDGGRIA